MSADTTTTPRIATQLRILASQENHDGEPWDTMIKAATHIDLLASQIANLIDAIGHTTQRIRDFEKYLEGLRGNPPTTTAALAFADKAISDTKDTP